MSKQLWSDKRIETLLSGDRYDKVFVKQMRDEYEVKLSEMRQRHTATIAAADKRVEELERQLKLYLVN